MKRLVCLLAILFLSMQPAMAQQDSINFNNWVHQFRARAVAQGIAPSLLDQVLPGLVFKPRVIELDNKQPEKKITFAQYRKNIVNDLRIRKGRAMMVEHRAELARASQTYGVPPQYIVALWGIETNYGANTGGFDILSALATLAYEGRRAAFFEKELVNALKILQAEHITPDRMTGSWAGAMGQNQFMPSSFLRFAVDGNGDGHRDIWNTKADVFASTANYLSTQGWNKELRWGRAVMLSQRLSADMLSLEVKKPLSMWRALGVRQLDGQPLPMPADGTDPNASLVAPDGPAGPIFLVYDNYRVIMDWNRSTYFATSVGLLADAIAAGN